MFCTNCGNELPNDHKFCGKCGNKMQEQYAEMDKGAVVLAEEPEFVSEQNFRDTSFEMQQVEQTPAEQTQVVQATIIQEQESQSMMQHQAQSMIEQQVKPVQQVQQAKPAQAQQMQHKQQEKLVQGQPINEQQVQQQSPQNVQQAPKVQVQKMQLMQTENYQHDTISSIHHGQLAVPADYDKVLSMWSYLGMLIVSFIPLIGFIAAIAWVIKKGNRNKRKFAAALLILQIIGIAAGIFAYPATISLLKTVLKGLNTGIG